MKTKLRDNKARAQQDHAKRRFQERYGLRLTQFIHDGLVHAIHSQGATLVRRQSHRVCLYDIDMDVRAADIADDTRVKPGKMTIRVVYDKQRRNIVSALEPHMSGLDHSEELEGL